MIERENWMHCILSETAGVVPHDTDAGLLVYTVYAFT
jgi:hypothetical protein